METQRGTPQANHAYLLLMQTLATRTAELHRALGTSTRDPAFAPEPLTAADAVESWKAQVKAEAEQTLALVKSDELRGPGKANCLR